MSTPQKPGYATIVRVLKRDLLALELRATTKADFARVQAVREELSRAERGEL